VFQVVAEAKQNVNELNLKLEKFTKIVNDGSAMVKKATKRLSDPNDTTARDDAIRDLTTLGKRVEALREETKGVGAFSSVLLTYSGAIVHWKQGMELLRSDNAQAQVHFKKGDTLLQDALKEYNKRFAKPKNTRGRR
jgi:hypothetical protein